MFGKLKSRSADTNWARRFAISLTSACRSSSNSRPLSKSSAAADDPGPDPRCFFHAFFVLFLKLTTSSSVIFRNCFRRSSWRNSSVLLKITRSCHFSPSPRAIFTSAFPSLSGSSSVCFPMTPYFIIIS